MENDTLFPIADISGTPYEIGLQHGSIFKTQIANSIETYRVMFRDYSNLEWEQGKKMAQRYIEPIRDYNPDYIEEMKGVADGSGVSFDDILTLNARSELVLQANSNAAPEVDGCTSIAITPDASVNGHMLAAHNWDWKDTQRPSMVMMNITQKNGKPTIHLITEAGIIGKTGFNSAGISLYLNALSVDSPPNGLPIHIAMRGILDSESLSDAMTAAVRMQLGCCANFLIAHKSGEAVDIEISNNDFDVLLPKDGIIVHTNHFLSPRLPRDPHFDTFKRKLPDSFLRQYRAEKRLAAINVPIGMEDLKSVLQDHTGAPEAICRHNNMKHPAGQRLCTVFSIVIDLTANEMHFCPGSPCETPYRVYRFDQ